MSKIIYILNRRRSAGQDDGSKLRQICERLVPDNLTLPAPHKIKIDGTIAYGISNHRHSLVSGNSVLLGCLYEESAHWQIPGSGRPDGSYAMFREDAAMLEVASDGAASRTIWYYFDDERFIASTSQRAIIMFLGNLDFDDRVVPWMLSSGVLGPDCSWDKRIKRLPPDASVVVDKFQWSIAMNIEAIVFRTENRKRLCQRKLLAQEVHKVVQSLHNSTHVNNKEYALPLSGGYDSRGILCFLGERGKPTNFRTITWGLASNLNREGNDAAVASRLASKMGVAHRYFHTDRSGEPIDKVMDRFILCGEGRVDHLSGYMDGLEIWRRLLEEEGVSGIIRGDEGFGWVPVSSELTVRLAVGIGLCSDYRNLDGVLAKFELPPQELPADLRRRKGETLETWRDRLYHAYRMPTILAALSDIKYSYVDIINPLLARSVLRRVRELPDDLRTGKVLYKEIVDSVSPAVPYARDGANAAPDSILRKKDIVEAMRSKLQSAGAKRILHPELLDHVSSRMQEEGGATGEQAGKSWRRLKALVPRALKNRARDLIAKPSVDPNVLAFRVFLVVRMHELLNLDCKEVAAGSMQSQAIHEYDTQLS